MSEQAIPHRVGLLRNARFVGGPAIWKETPCLLIAPRRRQFPLECSLNYFAYNFIKIHQTLRVSPAMAAGVKTRMLDVADLVRLFEESECKKAA